MQMHLLLTFHCVCVLCVIVYLLELQAAASGNVARYAASDERTALDQALLLVEILKSEYAKVVRENEKLHKNMIISEPTCAATTENPLTVTFTIQNTKLLYDSPDKLEAKQRQAPATPFGPWNYNSFHRRRWLPPAAYYYYGEPNEKANWRRFQNDNFMGTQPDINKTHQTSSGVTSATLNDTTAATTTVMAVSKPPSPITKVTAVKSAEKTVHEKTSSSPIHTTTNKITTHTSSLPTGITKLLFSKQVPIATSSKLEREPELSQASDEFAKELVDAVPRSGRQRHLPALWRGTTRVYLADSTRYPLPLPDNHAFCFTNPHSALCRTLV